MNNRETDPPPVLRTALFFSFAFGLMYILMIGTLWAASVLLPSLNIGINYPGASVMLLTFLVLGFLMGLGQAYGERPEDKIGILNIWLTSVAVMIGVAIAAANFLPTLWPEEWSRLEILLVAGMWIALTCILACVGLSKRGEVIKQARKEGTEHSLSPSGRGLG